MNNTTIKSWFIAVSLVVSVSLLDSCSQSSSSTGSTTENIDSLKKIALQLVAADDTISSRLTTFDVLDFEVFSNQQWDRFKESHAQNIKVFWPDGHITEGLPVHIEDMKKLFIHAPDTRIKEHPIKFGSGNYTLVTGVFEGTFTKPMPIGNGKFIQPTGKAFKMPMATVGIWENGVMIEEHLFWDNQTYAKQIGL
ncbi:ester cyclase [Flavihumibacter fluvii]|uniref:ester cyclase n=1 Tax=Flavihumibacter fluvii TaxID=2838157 RepID=UPI001EFAE6CB|nr:ester cyclase [Flavihumibacter fluvii]ULQ50946.1 ester cyclase [Flavihumibacter fluvii]